MKSPHAEFTYLIRRVNGIQISRFPFLADEVEEFKIVYQNITNQYEDLDDNEISVTFDCLFAMKDSIYEMFSQRNSNFNVQEFESFVEKKEKQSLFGESIFDLYDQFTSKDKKSILLLFYIFYYYME